MNNAQKMSCLTIKNMNFNFQAFCIGKMLVVFFVFFMNMDVWECLFI